MTEEWNDIRKQTPIVMGEFGCNAKWYPNASMCSPHVRQLQVRPTPRALVRSRPILTLVVPADLELRRWLHKLALLDVRLQRRSAGLVRDGG